MSLTAWKSFNFFEVSRVQLPNADSQAVLESNIGCLCPGSENLFIGTGDGMVHILSSSFNVIRSFLAYNIGAVTYIEQLKSTPFLITVAEDLPNLPVLKVWQLDLEDKKAGTPRCLTTLTVNNGHKQFPVSAVAVMPNLSDIAVAFANGSVTLIRGDFIHERGTKQTTIFESEEPITGLVIRPGTSSTLFISTTNRILSIAISSRVQNQTPRTLENIGCAVGCMAFDRDTGDVVVARDDAIYTYRVHGRGPSFGFDSPKSLINVFRDWVALVSPPKPRPDSWQRFDDDIFNTTTFTILDPDLRYVAHSEQMISGVRYTFSEWDDLFIVSMDGKIYRYHEKTLQQKLDILYQRNLYILAINMAQKAGVDRLQQNVIFRKYGDFLYQKGDYDTAMQQYLRAIDNTEPSQVIRKFLDTQHIHNLIEFLEELHYHGKATADHTTLLLNCYAKLKDTSKLDAFIKEPGELKFDLDTAITMCRQGGYFEQAAHLAKKYKDRDLVVDILIEDSKKYEESLDYICSLEPEAAYYNVMKYARVLLGHCPDKTTDFFIRYYTGKYQQSAPASEEGEHAPQSQVTPENPPAAATETPTPTPPSPQYQIPGPRTAFSLFVDQPNNFVQFLEALVERPHMKEEDRSDVYTTLFEMYLDVAQNTKDPQESEVKKAKARKLIQGDNIPVSTSNVLLLSDLSNFQEGTTLVREKQGLCADIFRSYTSAKDTAGVIRALKKYGHREPQLYIDALTYFTSSPRILKEAGDEFHATLAKIDQDQLLSPIQIVQALGNNDVVTVGMVKKYLNTNIERERKEISNNRKLIASYTEDTDAKRAEVAELGSQSVIFQTRRCSSCSGFLDLPTVHFLCKHSFHKRCLNFTEDDQVLCPLCAPKNNTIKAIRERQILSASQHDIFHAELQRSRNRYGVISEYFGRGVMGGGSGMEGLRE